MMDSLFIMALWGSVASIVALLVRPFIKKRSNRIMCLLWIVVMFRFLCPFAIESPLPVMHTENTQAMSTGEALEEADAENQKVHDRMVAEPGRYQRSDRNDGYQLFGNAEKENAIRNMSSAVGTQFADGTYDDVTTLAAGGVTEQNEINTESEKEASDGIREVSGATDSDVIQVANEMTNTGVTQITGETRAYNATVAHDATAAQNRTNTDGGIQTSFSSTISSLANAITFLKESFNSAGARFMLKCFGIVWILGTMLFMGMGIRRYYSIVKALQESVLLRKWDNFPVRMSDISGVPMAFGILHPGIYVPVSFEERIGIPDVNSFSDRQKDMILWHESTHLKRHDPLWKLVTFMMVSIHWWNPLSWICMKCINQDIEMACDEMVLARIGQKNKGEYAKTLLGFATRQSGISLMASFGESHAESRIKNALKYRKSPLGLTIVTSVLVFVLGGCLALRPAAMGENRGQKNGEE